MTLGRIVSILFLAAIIVACLYYTGVIHLGPGGVELAGVKSPAGPADFFDKGELAFTEGKFAEAADFYTKAVQQSPEDPRVADAEYRLGRCWDEQKDDRKVLAAYKLYLSKNPQGTNVKKASERVEYLTQALGR